MRYGATHRGFESRPLRQLIPPRATHLALHPGPGIGLTRSGVKSPHQPAWARTNLHETRPRGTWWRPEVTPSGVSRIDSRAAPAGTPADLPTTLACYHRRAVLGGELAVPCTCNPLQQG